MEPSNEFKILQELLLTIDLYSHIKLIRDNAKSDYFDGEEVIIDSAEEKIDWTECEVTDDDIYSWKICNLSEVIALSLIRAVKLLQKRNIESNTRLPVVELADVDFTDFQSELQESQDTVDSLCSDCHYFGDDLNNIWQFVKIDLEEICKNGDLLDGKTNLDSIDQYKSNTFAVTEFIEIEDTRPDRAPSISQFIRKWYAILKEIIDNLKLTFDRPNEKQLEIFITERAAIANKKCMPSIETEQDKDFIAMPKSKIRERLEENIFNILHPNEEDSFDNVWKKCVDLCFDADSGKIENRALGHFLIRYRSTFYAEFNLGLEGYIFSRIKELNKYRLMLDDVNYPSNKVENRYGHKIDAFGEHPLAPFIRRSDKVEPILDWLHRAIEGQKTPKEQLAPIKAAMDCHPQAVNSSLTLEIFNEEFGLNVSLETWKNWIKGNRGNKYDEVELSDYIDELEDIML